MPRVTTEEVANHFHSYAGLPVQPPSRWHRWQLWCLRQAVHGLLPLRGLWPRHELSLRPRQGRLSFELVSHCWQYSHLLEYQLGSLVAHPPRDCQVTLTVYYSREDARTHKLLELASGTEVANVRWNWRAVPKEHLFRRSVGRNHAALNTEADWIWFTDCDLMWGESCLDTLAANLQGRIDVLVYPSQENLTTLLGDDELILGQAPSLRVPSGALEFSTTAVTKAKGPLQIMHGDAARAIGYCRDVAACQRAEPVFQKCIEDTVFRWLLGTHGTPVSAPNVSRIRHLAKGRYSGSRAANTIRTWIRRSQEVLR
jgi:hypothetical protein